ncbi:MAG: CHAD domain-containing protein, partial [Acidobacteriia bacterium]|nr:CHAD domain-containing protein [Terriglobia bacterium]
MTESDDIVGLPSPKSEIATGLAPPPVPSPPDAEPLDAWKKVRKLALRQLDRFISLEPKVLRGDDRDAIHDLRVASRRLQQVLDLLYPPPRPAEIRKLRRKIRRSRRALGEVRNCDVQLQHVERILARKRAARRQTWEAVRHYLRQRRAESFDKAMRKLSKINLAIFYVHLKDHLTPNGTGLHAHGSDPVCVGKAVAACNKGIPVSRSARIIDAVLPAAGQRRGWRR